MECILNQVDPQFETSQGFQYRLSMLLSPDGFSFLVTHALSRRILKISSYKLLGTDLKSGETGSWPDINHYFDLLRTIDCVQQTYQSIDIAFASHKITVVPSGFSGPDSISDIMNAVQLIIPGEKMITEDVVGSGLVVAAVLPSFLLDNCTALFPGSNLRIASAVFIKGIFRKNSGLNERQVFINMYNEHFELSVIQGVKLLYLNAFRYSEPGDVLYYVVFVLEQLGFIPSEQTITLMGNISMNSNLAEQLKMYFASLSFADVPEGMDAAGVFAGKEMHTYFTLLNIPICE